MAADSGNLSDNEKSLFDNIQKRNVSEVKRILAAKDVRINCVDEHGMTPLQHAAYKGGKELCSVLLDHGAAVNHNEHKHGYTALMFGALSGSMAVTSLLLEAGASTTAVNSVGRTASQMAAFVGNHACVSIINNFIPKETIEYYTIPRGLEKEPKLPPRLSGLVHRFVIRLNIHPVGIALFVQSNPVLIDEAISVIKVLELLSERQMKKGDTDEISALKFHHLAYVLKNIHHTVTTQKNKPTESGDEKSSSKKSDKSDPLTDLIKFWMKGRPDDGFPENLEKLLRQGIRDFRFVESSILQQLVRNLAPVKIGDEPSAISLLTATINGQKGADSDACATCGEFGTTLKKCSACKGIDYCSQQCQKLHWFTHKKICPQLAKEIKELESEVNKLDTNETNKQEE